MEALTERQPRSRRRVLAWPAAVIFAAALLAGSPAEGGAPTYSLQLLGDGVPTAINDQGEVVGFRTAPETGAWFADQEGSMIDLPVPDGAIQTKANDINNSSLIVGTASMEGYTPRACSWSLVDGAWEVTLLESLPISFGSYGVAVNDLGDIVGTNIGTLGSRAVYFTGPGGGPIDLNALGMTELPVDVNNERQVAGGQLVFDLDDSTVFDTGVPDPDPQHYLWSDAVAINDAGQIVARTVTATGSFYPVATKWDPETGWHILSGPATGNTAADINDNGDVLIHIQSTWGQQPYLLLDGGGAYRVQTLLDPELEFWFIENIGAMAMNDDLELAVVVSNFVSGEYGTARLTPQPEPGDPADINGDGVVDLVDLLALLAAWGDCEGCPEDLDGDGTVGSADLLQMLSSWGPVG